MPSTMQINYSKCPLKKRPVYFTFEESDIKDEPENLCIKKEFCNDNKKFITEQIQVKKEHKIENFKNLIHDEYDDKITSSTSPLSPSVIIPTPQYPKLNIQPWSFHIPYSSEFYRNITTQHQPPASHHNYHHHQHQHPQQISPLRGDLHSPNTSSLSEGSLSPPPHYLNGRPNSVSPPMREQHHSQLYHHHQQHHHSIINAKQNCHIIKPEVIPSHRFLPYQLPAYHQSYSFNLNHQQLSPISPTYSDTSSFYSMRSHTPESICSSATALTTPITAAATVPEDLSIKQNGSTSLSALPLIPLSPSSVSSSSSSSVSSTSSSLSSAASSKSSTSIISTHNKSHHENKSSPPRYQCPDCNKSYSTFSGLTKHQQYHCPAAEGNQVKKSFSCKDCEKTYFSLGALKMHIRTHTLPCKCTICGKAFSRPWLLQGHIRTHTGEKPFSCQHCHRAFADRSNLRAHLQTHSDIKKYSCTTCSKTFSRMSLLTKHNEGGCPGINGSASPAYLAAYPEH